MDVDEPRDDVVGPGLVDVEDEDGRRVVGEGGGAHAQRGGAALGVQLVDDGLGAGAADVGQDIIGAVPQDDDDARWALFAYDVCLYAGHFGSPHLEPVVVREIGRLELVWTFPKVYSGRHVTHPAFDIYRSESVRVESAVPLRKILDGDVVGTEPMNATTRHAAIRALVPKTI